MSQRCFSVFWVNEGTSPTVMGRFLIHDGSVAQQADITSVGYKVYDVDDPSSVIIEDAAVDVSAVFYDTLQTDSRWTLDSTGFNFAWAAPVTACPDGGKTYIAQFTTQPDVGAVIKDAVELKTRNFVGE